MEISQSANWIISASAYLVFTLPCRVTPFSLDFYANSFLSKPVSHNRLTEETSDTISFDAFDGTTNLYNGIDDPSFGAGTGRLSILNRNSSADRDYLFHYNIPDQGKAFSKFVYRFVSPIDFTRYTSIKILMSFSDDEAKCAFESHDNVGRFSIVLLSGGSMPSGVNIEANVDSNGVQTVLIPMSYNFLDTDKRSIQEVAVSTNSYFIRGSHSCVVHDIILVR